VKVKIFDRRIVKIFLETTSALMALLSGVLIFVDIPDGWKWWALLAYLALHVLIYIRIWYRSNRLNHVEIDIEGTKVTIKVGDIFSESGLKAIAFNEYFDTEVDNKIISDASLNGIFLKKHLGAPISRLDKEIEEHPFEPDEVLDLNETRVSGKKQRFRLGTIMVHGEYLLAAMSKFDESNRATLTMPEYLEFLIRFWDRVNKVYAQKSVSTPIFGSGITRIKGHKSISDEDLLKIMLWTFRISEMRFKYPARLSIIVHEAKIDQINLLDMKLIRNGV
jgi:hypothetical protein